MDRRIYETGLEHAKNDRFNDALKIFCELQVSNPQSPLLAASIANAYWNLDNLDAAIVNYRKAIELKPDFEEASLGLIHCHLDNGNPEAGKSEARRYLSVATSDEIRMVLSKIETGSK